MLRRLLPLLLLGLSLLLPGPAAAFELPGLENDASGYEAQLSRRFPAGATPQQRAAAEARARAAETRNDWAAAATAWEERLGAGQANADHWMALANAQLRRTPPEAARALQAGWRAFMLVPAGPPEIPSLLVMAEALRRLDRPAAQLQALEAVVERAPDNPQYRENLATARRAAGLLVRRTRTEPEAEPARVCLDFTSAPSRRSDWQPGDWVRADPPIPGLAVEKEGDTLCVAGLPWGRTTRLTLRAGMPGEDGLRLNRDTPINVAMPNRQPRIVFDSRAFILPRGQEPRVTVTTINLAALHLRLIRVSERNLVSLTRDWRPGEMMEQWVAENIAEDMGRVVWEGRAELPRAEPNTVSRSALPVPDALRNAGPGMYILVARPGDGTRDRWGIATALPILATDLGITAWRGPQGIAAQIRGFTDAAVRPGVTVRLLARNNDILAETTTGADGTARFGAAAMRGSGPLAPLSIHAFLGEDFASLDLETASFDLSDRGAAGRPHPGPLDAFVWLDRGIYRPGETVQVAALLRDAGGAPADIPARVRVRRPNGQVFFQAVPPRLGGAAIVVPVQLSGSSPMGQWTVEVLADPDAPPIGSTTFKVEAFVPERLEVTAGPAPGPLVPGTPLEIPVTARFLYGAPGAGLTGDAEMRLSFDEQPWEQWRGWRFGLMDETFAPDLTTFEIPETDAQGRSTLTLNLPTAPDTTRPVKADVTILVAEPGGRTSGARLSLPVRARGTLLAIRPGFEGGSVDANAEAGFEIAAVSPDGAAIAANLRLRLVRERPNWRLVFRERIARYETVWRDEPVDSQEIQVAPGAPARFARRLPFGRYRIEVTEPNGLAIASYRFRSGWASVGAEAAEVPDRVDLAADRRAYAPGDVARLRITPPFAGRASVAVLTDRVLSLREVDVPEAGAEVEVPVDAAWGPGAHVAVTVFRAGNQPANRPGRALGLAWIGLDPASRRLDVAIESPDLARPNRRVEIPVRLANAAGGTAMLTLAAVDEGILRLTNFRSPDPVEHFLARRRLGLDIRDDYGRLIAPAEGEAAALRQGGDGFDAAGLLEIPQRVVALFSGAVQVGADGRAMVPLDLPDFAGELRLMVVAWDGNRIGNAARPMTVREQAVAEALLPRFLAPGDEARLPLLLHNVELPAGDFAITLSASGAIELAGPARLTQTLAAGARAQPATALRALTAGEGVLRLAVTGPNGFTTERHSTITVRSSRPPVTEVAVRSVGPNETAPVPLPSDRFIAGTWRATATWGAPVRYDPQALLASLRRFPLDCLEQASSRVLALAHAPANPDTAQEDAAALGQAIASVLDRQRFDGRFGFWSAEGSVHGWSSVYAVEALLRARAAGATVPEAALAEALKAVEEGLDGDWDGPEALATQAYRVHVLALAGRNRLGAARRLAELELATPLARAQVAAAFARAGDRARAETLFATALANPQRNMWWGDYGTAARDSLASAVLLRESGVAQDRLPALLARLPGADFTPAVTNTQEQAWAVAAASLLGRDGRPARLTFAGRDLPVQPIVAVPLTAPGSVTNRGDGPVVQAVSIFGVPTSPLPAASQGMRVARRFFALDGQPLNLDALRSGTNFVLLVELRATTGERHEAMIVQGLPAGWEIAGRLPSGDIQGMSWLGTLTEALAVPARDDRFSAAIELTPSQPLARLAVRLRAVTPGRFELPGLEAQDMYRPGVYARQDVGRITVLGPEDPLPTPPAPRPTQPAPAQRPGTR